jgi:hypothetical protein
VGKDYDDGFPCQRRVRWNPALAGKAKGQDLKMRSQGVRRLGGYEGRLPDLLAPWFGKGVGRAATMKGGCCLASPFPNGRHEDELHIVKKMKEDFRQLRTKTDGKHAVSSGAFGSLSGGSPESLCLVPPPSGLASPLLGTSGWLGGVPARGALAALNKMDF